MDNSTDPQTQELLSSTSLSHSPSPSPAPIPQSHSYPHHPTPTTPPPVPRSTSSFTRSPLGQTSSTPDSLENGNETEGRKSTSTRSNSGSGSGSGSHSGSASSRAGIGAGGGVGNGNSISRPASRGSVNLLLSSPSRPPQTPPLRNSGSMILYRLASDSDLHVPASASTPVPISRNSTFSNILAAGAHSPLPSGSSGPPSLGTASAGADPLLPPVPHFRRASTFSSLGGGNESNRSSIVSYSEDESKYPTMYGNHAAGLGMSAAAAAGVANAVSQAPFNGGQLVSAEGSEKGAGPGGAGAGGAKAQTLVPYVYDPLEDGDGDAGGEIDEMDLLHDPTIDENAGKRVFSKGGLAGGGRFPWRGIVNVAGLVTLLLALIALFVGYPVIRFYRDEPLNSAIDGNIQVNSTGQVSVPAFPFAPTLVDVATPESAMIRTGYDGEDYELVFSDEFSIPGRTFYQGDDPYWEAVDIWYGATGDLEWYDPSQVTTRDGYLVITMDSTNTTEAKQTPNSTAPFTAEENHNLSYRSGMLQSWNKFCFSSGYIEVSLVLPGPNSDTQGYWPGVWTMGNLGRPGYGATTDGMWPYTYDSCDVGTFPNQTLKDGSGPAAALHSDASRSKYNYELSWLSGQRLSACTCPSTSSYTPDHPGPFRSDSGTWLGRGAPEIDVLEAERNKVSGVGQVVSQSAQFAPFSHDYTFLNSTDDEFKIWNTTGTRINSYHGSAVQQAVSALSDVPNDGFQGSGKSFVTYGFEYWADPSSRSDGFITWQVDGKATARMGAASVGPDQGSDGSGVSQRLIPEEPMSIVLNLGISQNWQTIDLSTMIFPAEMLVDYVRVYQRKGQTNVGCNPKGYPTADYIQSHMDSYSNPNLTAWNYEKPKNSQYDGC